MEVGMSCYCLYYVHIVYTEYTNHILLYAPKTASGSMESSGRNWRKVVAVWVHITFLLDHVVVAKIADINYMYLYIYIYICIPRKFKDETLPIGSRKFLIQILDLPKDHSFFLCLIFDFQGTFMYIIYSKHTNTVY